MQLTGGLAAALAAAAGLVLLAVGVLLLRRAPPRMDGPEDAAAAAEAALPGFRAKDAVLGADGLGALVVADDGRVAAARPRGRRVAVHEVAWSALRPTPDGVVVDAGRLGAVRLVGVNALHVRRLVRGG